MLVSRRLRVVVFRDLTTGIMLATSAELPALRLQIMSEKELDWRLRRAVRQALEVHGGLVTAMLEVGARSPPGFFPWHFEYDATVVSSEGSAEAPRKAPVLQRVGAKLKSSVAWIANKVRISRRSQHSD